MTVYNGPVAMPNVNDLRTIVQGVEQAEARGDHVTAERLLRQALALQETSVGPNHPEVANILNNLAIVCELNGKLTDAEACYRRAHGIATSSLPANDPFVTTSRENLEQFCTARGISVKEASPKELKETSPVATSPAQSALSAFAPAASSAPPPRPAPPPSPPKMPSAAPKKAAPLSPRSAAPSLDDFPLRSPSAVPVTPRTLSAPAAIREPSRVPATAAVLALLAALLAAGWYLIDSNSRERAASAPPPSASATPTPSPTEAPAEPTPAPQPEPAAPAPATPSSAPESVAPPTPAPATRAPAVPERPAATTTKATVTALTAEVCSSLTRTGAWTCAPATNAQAPGVMYFYTRVASPRDTTIEHRWYRGDTLVQRVPLRIRANPSGFRTYSQNRISADRTGTWKVELRTEDGQLIDEKTFAIR
jgi:hypothetical protein